MLISVQNVAIDSSKKFNTIAQTLSTQGNSSSIPGLSQPGALPPSNPVVSYGGNSAAVSMPSVLPPTSSSSYGSGSVTGSVTGST